MIAQSADHLITIVLVASALAFVVRRAWHVYVGARATRNSNCGPGCGCD